MKVGDRALRTDRPISTLYSSHSRRCFLRRVESARASYREYFTGNTCGFQRVLANFQRFLKFPLPRAGLFFSSGKETRSITEVSRLTLRATRKTRCGSSNFLTIRFFRCLVRANETQSSDNLRFFPLPKEITIFFSMRYLAIYVATFCMRSTYIHVYIPVRAVAMTHSCLSILRDKIVIKKKKEEKKICRGI